MLIKTNLLKFWKIKIKLIRDNFEINRITNKGLPQGSSISPDLFNIYTADLHKLERENKKMYQFADDLTILITEKEENKLLASAKILILKLITELKKNRP